MRSRRRAGELVLCGFFVATGAFWAAVAAGLPLWEGFAPATGFLPLVYGVLLVTLALAATLVDVLARSGDGEERQPIRHPLIVLLALAAGVAGIEPAGFPFAMAATMLFLFRIVERLPLPASVAAALATAAGLTLVFRTWLGVPLPAGPWGF